jgi:hypothetical protein
VKFLLRFLARLVLWAALFCGGFLIGNYYRMEKDAEYVVSEEIRLRELYDRYAASNTIYKNQIRFPMNSIRKTDTWFQKQFKMLEASWQEFVLDVNGERIQSTKKQASLLRNEYIPWVKDLMSQVQRRDDISMKDEKLQILQLRLDSMYALDEYVRNSYDAEAYLRYQQNDSAFRNMIEEFPEILE